MNTIADIGLAWVIFCGCVLVFSVAKYFFFPNREENLSLTRGLINIFVQRRFFAATYTIGKLWIDNIFSCDTLEDTVRDFNKDGDLDDPGEGKIPGKTAIPYGRYKVIVKYSPKFKRKIPWILDVKNFTDIRIHALNWATQTEGCIGVGRNTIKGGLTESRDTERDLTALLLKYQDAGNEIYINVI